MNKFHPLLFTILITFGLTWSAIPDAHAKRFGGARSFGSKPSFSKAYRGPMSGAQRSTRQQKAESLNNAKRQQFSRRGGLMGMLGGLALGGLLGSLFFGGAFQGLNLVDLLIFGGIAYLLYRWFAAKQQATANATMGSNYYRDYAFHRDTDLEKTTKQQEKAHFNTDLMFEEKESLNPLTQDADFNSSTLPANFDDKAFLVGAKQAFGLLQSAWDQKDLATIRGLTTDRVFVEIQNQIKSSPDSNQTDVLNVEAKLLEIRELEEQIEAVVLFDSILREKVEEQAQQVKEIWHFTKPNNSSQTTWFLDGIQQLEH